mmetsp:Transcript_120647/g.286615  ORF Transcript_120647/g.286615 Transcript_120647/m.286615 type:complete len:260 (+) Transcript_120647:380-1159(+)
MAASFLGLGADLAARPLGRVSTTSTTSSDSSATLGAFFGGFSTSTTSSDSAVISFREAALAFRVFSTGGSAGGATTPPREKPRGGALDHTSKEGFGAVTAVSKMRRELEVLASRARSRPNLASKSRRSRAVRLNTCAPSLPPVRSCTYFASTSSSGARRLPCTTEVSFSKRLAVKAGPGASSGCRKRGVRGSPPKRKGPPSTCKGVGCNGSGATSPAGSTRAGTSPKPPKSPSGRFQGRKLRSSLGAGCTARAIQFSTE